MATRKLNGLSYWLTKAVKTSLGPDASALSVHKQCLYLAVTNETIGTPLPLSVGPGFSMPPTVGYGLPAFQPLSTESLILAEDPSAFGDTLAEIVEDAWERGFIKQDSMESDPITFAGYGDPLLRLSTVEAAAKAIKHRRHGAQLRLMTNGLVASGDASEVVQRLRDCGVSMLTVPLNAATPPKYAKLMQPPSGLGFQDVCNFVMVAAESGMSVECTAVDGIRGVKVKQVQNVAHSCGAREFRLRQWVPVQDTDV